MADAKSFEDLVFTMRSFQESRVLLSAIELDVFSYLAEERDAEELAAHLATDGRATGMLLNALVALGALEKQGERFRCTSESIRLGPMRKEFMHTAQLWERWSTLTACVKSGTSVSITNPGKEPSMKWTENFIDAMHARALPIASKLASLIGTAGISRMLDVGGGPGTYSIAFVKANPATQAEVLDLAPVLPMAARNIREAGLQNRIATREGDLRTDILGEGYDLILISAICHMLDDRENQDLLRRCANALKPGGRVVIRDFVLESDRTAPKHAAIFALNMLVGTKGGNAYTEAEYRQWLQVAGFHQIQRLEEDRDIIIGRRL